MENNEETKKELEKLEEQLQDPEIYNNAEKLKKVSKKYNELKKFFSKLNQLEEITHKIFSTEKMLNQESAPEMIEMIKQEIKKLETKKVELKKAFQEEDDNSDKIEKNVVIMEIRAGTGGDEAGLFVADLFRMYSRFAEKMKWKAKIISSHPTTINGFKEIIFEIKGKNVYRLLQNESGIHRVQRIPDTEKNGRIHTSAVSVAILPEAKEIDIKIENKELRMDYFRASGHGGQNVQKNETAIRITHIPTNTVVSCQDERSQGQNRERAMTILRSRLLAKKEEEENRSVKEKRQSQVGTGDRSEKIRTYNFPQDRVTDHRIHKSWHGLEQILSGNIESIIKSMTLSIK